MVSGSKQGVAAMAGVNKVILVGRLGKDPETRRLANGDPVVSFSLATSETWRDRQSGERKERTEWHNVVIFNDNLAKIAEQYLKKGSECYVEGQITNSRLVAKTFGLTRRDGRVKSLWRWTTLAAEVSIMIDDLPVVGGKPGPVTAALPHERCQMSSLLPRTKFILRSLESV